MKKISLSLIGILILQLCFTQKVATPDQIYGELFVDVQLKRIFPDNKTFVDCIPKRKPAAIVADYIKLKNERISNAEIKNFVEINFEIPPEAEANYQTNIKDDIIDHVEELWHILTVSYTHLRAHE